MRKVRRVADKDYESALAEFLQYRLQCLLTDPEAFHEPFKKAIF